MTFYTEREYYVRIIPCMILQRGLSSATQPPEPLVLTVYFYI